MGELGREPPHNRHPLLERGGDTLVVAGFWGPPFRVFAPGEITPLVLRSPQATDAQ